MAFKEIDHTADFGLEFYGKNKEELFISAANGLFSSITDLSRVNSMESYDIDVEGDDEEDLLIEWLRELLYLHHVKGILLNEFVITEITGNKLAAKTSGEPFDKKRHKINREIKAATYHELFVRKEEKGWRARVIFDI